MRLGQLRWLRPRRHQYLRSTRSTALTRKFRISRDTNNRCVRHKNIRLDGKHTSTAEGETYDIVLWEWLSVCIQFRFGERHQLQVYWWNWRKTSGLSLRVRIQEHQCLTPYGPALRLLSVAKYLGDLDWVITIESPSFWARNTSKKGSDMHALRWE